MDNGPIVKPRISLLSSGISASFLEGKQQATPTKTRWPVNVVLSPRTVAAINPCTITSLGEYVVRQHNFTLTQTILLCTIRSLCCWLFVVQSLYFFEAQADGFSGPKISSKWLVGTSTHGQLVALASTGSLI